MCTLNMILTCFSFHINIICKAAKKYGETPVWAAIFGGLGLGLEWDNNLWLSAIKEH